MKIVHSDAAPAAIGPYSQAIAHNGILYCSGQIALGADGVDYTHTSVEEQTERSLENLKAVIEAGGSSLNHVLKVGIFLADMDDFQMVNTVYARYFSSHKPARACVAVRTLPRNAMVEIECVAAIVDG
jgi:2-iminobutanoate/2-iminopropanoate deaminase